MTRILSLCLVLGLAGAAALADDKDVSLAGGYTLVSGMHGDKKLDEKVEGSTAKFTKDRIVVYAKDKKELYVASYKLETARKPWRITMTNEAKVKEKEEKGGTKETVKGLIEKDGDTVKLIYALPGGETPTDFKPAGDKHIMVVMKNLKK